MGPYDYSIMQDRDAFKKEMSHCVHNLRLELAFSEALNDILFKFLMLDMMARPSSIGIVQHSWFGGQFKEIVDQLHAEKLSTDSPRISRQGTGRGFSNPSTPLTNSPLLVNTNISNRERRKIESYLTVDSESGASGTQAEGDDSVSMRLPPIEPATPSIGKARKMLINGQNSGAISPQKSPAVTTNAAASKGSKDFAYSPDTNQKQHHHFKDEGKKFSSKSVETLQEEDDENERSRSLKVSYSP